MLMVILSIIGVVVLLTLINLKRGLTIHKDGNWEFKKSDGSIVEIGGKSSKADKWLEDRYGK